MCDSAENMEFNDPTDVFYSNDEFFNRKMVGKEKKIGKRKPEKKPNNQSQDGLKNAKRKREQSVDCFDVTNPCKLNKINLPTFEDDINIPENRLKQFHLSKLHCTGDGNCFFKTFEMLTNIDQNIFRQAVVSTMSNNASLFEALFKQPMRDNYFIEEDSVLERCINMEKDKYWAGFPERFAAALFLRRNICEYYETTTSSYWNIFVGTNTFEAMEQTNLENLYISYNVAERHFVPLHKENNFNRNMKITNVYFLMKSISSDSHGVFVKLKPSELPINHQLYQSTSEQLLPIGLRNIGNTCYFNSIIQCLKIFPEFCSALEADLPHIENPDSMTHTLTELFQCMHNRSDENILQKSLPNEHLLNACMPETWMR